MKAKLLETKLCEFRHEQVLRRYSNQIARLYHELDQSGLSRLRPKVYVSDEWFCPEASRLIAIPYYLGSNALSKLELEMRGEVEGESPDEFMRLLRHEAGHCFIHGYELAQRKDWQSVFGDPNQPYNPERKLTHDRSRFVANLEPGYAQTHPEEDFAETFAIWLQGETIWRKRYGKRPEIMRKLNLIDRLARLFGDTPPIVPLGRPLADATKSRRTLRQIYRRSLQ